MATEVLIKGSVSRALAQRNVSNARDGVPVRLGPYAELVIQSPVRKQYALAEEGSYFLANNGQAGIATPAVAAFGATTPVCVIYNTGTPQDDQAPAICLDYIALITTAAGSFASAGVNLQAAIYLDQTDRYTSGGTDLTSLIVSPNSDASKKSVAKVRFGNITAAAATGNVRALAGLRILRPVVSATVADVVGETKYLNFGGVEGSLNGSITVANANVIPIPLPPVRIGPGACALIYFIMNGTTPAAVSFAPEFGWWER